MERELRAYLDCGILARGFARVRCPDCGFERLVAFSCKAHVCPSCSARRMEDAAQHLVENVFPAVPVRQWVLSFPRRVRFLAARHPAFASRLLDLFTRATFAWHRRKARLSGVTDPRTGGVTPCRGRQHPDGERVRVVRGARATQGRPSAQHAITCKPSLAGWLPRTGS